MDQIPAVAVSSIARSHCAANSAKWVAVALLITAIAVNSWFIFEYTQNDSVDRSAAAAVPAAQTRFDRAEDDVAATKRRSDNAAASLRKQIGFHADQTTIVGLTSTHSGYLTAWENAQDHASTASTEVLVALQAASVARTHATGSGLLAVYVGIFSTVVVVLASVIWFTLSKSAARVNAMTSLVQKVPSV